MKIQTVYIFLIFFLLLSCKKERTTIRVATKPMTEQFILAEMLGQLIESNTPYGVEITKGIGGGTSNIHPALLKGEFDLYPEYTGTGWLVVLKKDSFPASPDALYRELQKEYHEKFGLKWVAPYGFNNSYSLALSEKNARKYNIHNFSDLAKYPGKFVFGAEYDFFEIPKGYDDMCQFYGLKFKKNRDMDIGLKYQAVKNGDIDVVNIFTTDGQLSRSGLVALKDDKHFFPTYYCATVVREDALRKYPELENVLMKMNNILTDSDMADLNYQVDILGRTDKEVAHEYLVRKSLLTRN